MRDGFIFYESFRDAMRGLPAETQLVLYNAIADYALYDIVPDFGDDGIAHGFFALMRPQIDANNRRRDAGARGRRPSKSSENEQFETHSETAEKPCDNQSETNAKPSDNQPVTMSEPKEKEKAKAKENDKANEKEKVKENAKAFCADKPRRFTNPTVADIREYCQERGNSIDPQRFYDFYEAKGWRVGNQPMKDWQAAVRTWEGRDSVKPRDLASTNPFKRMLQEEAKNGQTGNDADFSDPADCVPELLQGYGR